MSNVGTFTVEDGIGILLIDSPPVNALSLRVRKALDEGFRKFYADPAVQAIVLICGGRTFIAGADITELGKPIQEPTLREVVQLIEGGSKPVVAAIHGTALGGGYEMALDCHYRVAVPSAMVGLPEVKLGLLPGGGGTQRLPRLVGVPKALDIIVGGEPIPARRALELGMIDAIADEGQLKEGAIAFVRNILDSRAKLQCVRDRTDLIEPYRGNPEVFDEYRRTHAHATRGFKAPENIIKAIEAAVDLPFEEGLKREAELFNELLASPQSAAQRYFFFAEREAGKIPDIPADTASLPVRSVGVVGAGTMGVGIAMTFLNAGIPVTISDVSQNALDSGLAVIRRTYESSLRKGRLTQQQADQRVALLTPVHGLERLGDVDLIIEAVYEEMSLKKEIFAELDRIGHKQTILASNTSYLSIDELASATARPERVIGLHFFSPANIMSLLEVVRGRATSKEVIATGMTLARKIGKVAVLSRVAHGFIANRVMAQRNRQAEALVLRGTPLVEVDRALYDYGFAMGPFEMLDLAGLDVIGRGGEQTLRSEFARRGRLGQKNRRGFYDYDGNRKPAPSQAADEIIAEFAKLKGIPRAPAKSADEIIACLLFPVINEATKVLEEGVALRASDIDVACILGYRWPVYTGGPMFWADGLGLDKIVEELERLAGEFDPSFAPSKMLRDRASSREKLSTR